MRSSLIFVPLALAVVAGGVAVATPEVGTARPQTDRAAVARTANEADPYALPTKAVEPRPCVPRSGGGGTFHPPKPKVKTKRLPSPLPVTKRTVDLGPLRGKGMWLTTWEDTHLDVPRLVTQAKRAGLKQLWVRTGGSRQGWYGTALLTELLPAAHAARLAVVAWDFPFLSDPMRDVKRARKAIEGTFGGQRIDAFSPDIESIYEGTFNAKPRLQLYLSHIRKAAGSMPIVSTVMRPTEAQLRAYPYAAQVPYIDAFAPMVYWGCHEPGKLAKRSLKVLSRWRPVHLVGQSYDMGGEGGPRGVPPRREVWRFLDVAKRSGALGASLYNYDGAHTPQWEALGRFPWSR